VHGCVTSASKEPVEKLQHKDGMPNGSNISQ